MRQNAEKLKSQTKIERKLHDIVSAVNAALLIADAAGKIEIANRRLGELLGCPDESLVGRQFTDIFVCAHGEDLSEKLRATATRATQPWSATLQAQNSDCETINLTASFSPIEKSADHIGVLVLLSPRATSAQTSESPVQSKSGGATEIFAASQLQMIGLDDIKEALGERWDRLAACVYDIANTVLTARLADEDVFYRDANGDYFICFAKLSADAARLKAKSLRQELREALISEDIDDQLKEFALDVHARERLSNVKAETFEIELPGGELSDIPDLVGLIKERIDNAGNRLREQAGTILTQLANNCGIRFLSAKSSMGKPMPLQVAELDPASQAKVEQLRNVYDDAPQLLGRIDFLLLGATIERLYNFDQERLPLTVVEVHYTTLANPRMAQKYFNLCRSAIGKPAKSLIIKVRDIPPDLNNERISKLLQSVRPYSRLTAIQLTQPGLSNIDVVKAGVSLVAMEFADLNPMLKRNKKAVIEMAETLLKHGVRLAVDHVASYEDLQALKPIEPNYYTTTPTTVALPDSARGR